MTYCPRSTADVNRFDFKAGSDLLFKLSHPSYILGFVAVSFFS